jgi:hypothetical protein
MCFWFWLTSDDFDASSMTCSDHTLVLGPRAAFGGEYVGDGLIIGPPLRALDVLGRRAHYETVNTLDAGMRTEHWAYLEHTRNQQVREKRYTPQRRYPKSIRTSGQSRLGAIARK